ncbi:TonB-dependent receptor [Chitinophaga agrisoli]|uniref:TonB-dependent receptor n=1 Tax=Chitinophaga agrisoli TaxID=2607653 RepID=A0A5B2VZA7_9BACT|nr:TonB-dependent receptor [Chitinophaga agrisoli]KAA2243359.1 TonB-dependent receptor [Chitinophaga agrisoli]
MKLGAYYLILGFTLFTCLPANSLMAQKRQELNKKITLHLPHSTADEVINAIRKQSGYSFLYDPSELKQVSVDDLKFDETSLQDVLDYLHRTAGLSFAVNDKTISVQMEATGSQQLTDISGRVVEAETGLPLPGATVRIKDGNVALTDDKGRFHIKAAASSLLIVSFSGYQAKEIRPGNGKELLIRLELSHTKLNEVVVVGYGTQLKEKVTGAVATLGEKDLKNAAGANLTEAMVGKLPGVQVSQITGAPGAGLSIRVRGTGSITAGNEPLYVVDGFPLEESSLSNFNMGDIETISVLKDASATSIYGSRGSNGVVIITTKRGKSGKPQVSLNSYVGLSQINKKLDLLSPEEFVDFAIEARNNAWEYLGGHASDPNSVRSPLYQISPYLYDQKDWVRTDWQDEVFRTAPVNNNELSVSGGSDNFKYMLSGAYYNQDGVIKNSWFKRYSLRGNIDAQPLKVLHISGAFSTAIVNDKMAQDEGQFNDGVLGTLINTPGIYGTRNPDGSYPSFVGFGYGVSEVANPMTFINEDNKRNDRNRTTANIAAELQLLPGLKFKSMAGFDYNSDRINEFFNSYVNDLPANPGQVKQVTQASGSYDSRTDFSWLSENTLNYNFNAGLRNNFEVLMGFTAQKATTEMVSLSATNFPNNLVPTLNAGQISGGSTLRSEWSLLSYLARVNYSYSNRYFATATIRRDGSSRFGADNRWGVFPSLSLGWMVSNEKFFSLPWVSSLKVRASYGLAGNNDIANYGAIGLLGYSDYVIGGKHVSGISPSTLSNQDLSWEKSAQADAGIEAGLLHNRINLTVDLYQRVSNDLLLDVPVPSILGLVNSLENIGKVRNRGLEIGLNTRNIDRKFKWSTDLNFSLNRNIVLELGADGAPIIASTSGDSHITEVGKPIGNFFGYIFDGVYNTQDQIDHHAHLSTDRPGDPIVRDVSGDGQITTADRTILGNYQPDFTYGITNHFSFANVDLSVMLQGVQGAEIMDLGMRQSLSMTGRTNNLGIARDRWRSPEQPGNGKVFKAITDVYGVRRDASSFYMQNGSYLRIRNITLGYNFPAALIGHIGMSAARVYFSAQNPFTFTDYVGYNPEVSSYHSALTPGVDYFNYPLARTFSAGFNVTF